MLKNALNGNGAIIYRGPSMLDGSPIVAIAIGLKTQSKNAKTGSMLQTYILRDDMDPLAAVNSGADSSICGDCVYRGVVIEGKNKKRRCYVNLGQGPLGVFKAFSRGRYAYLGDDINAVKTIGNKRLVRLGTYGDPAAVPLYIWDALLSLSTGHTGYTHQWRTRPELKTICMASADNEQDRVDAKSSGWRTFRVAMPNHTARIKGEAVCPASKEAGKKLVCETCLSCSGAGSRRSGDIVIQAHGSAPIMKNIREAVQLRGTLA